MVKFATSWGSSAVRVASISLCVVALTMVLSVTEASAAACLEEAFGDTLNCTANDVEVAFVTVTGIDEVCDGTPGDTFTFDGLLNINVNAVQRFDLGFYVGEDPLASPNDDCSVAIGNPNDADYPFADLDGDTCGDTDAPRLYKVPVQDVTVPCQDSDGNGRFDLNICSSWSLNPEVNCFGPEFAVPSTKSKCNCGIVDTSLLDVFVPGFEDSGRLFGSAVSLTADYFVVGAPGSPLAGGEQVHVFRFSDTGSAVEQSQSTPVAVPFEDRDHASSDIDFGASVDADGETIVVGAPLDVVAVGDKQSSGSASVYFWNGSEWDLQQKLVDESGLCDQLGTDVAVSGDRIVLGAPAGNCALVFHRSGSNWTLADRLEAGAENGRFGQSVDVSGDSIIVGAPTNAEIPGDGCGSAGAAYAFRWDGQQWTLEDTIEEPGESGGNACFGAAVAIDGPIAVVGAPFADDAAADVGAAFVVERIAPNWEIASRLLASEDGTEGARFGASLDVWEKTIVVGAPGVAAYRFEPSPIAASVTRTASGGWRSCRRYEAPKCDPNNYDPQSCDPELVAFGGSVAVFSRKGATSAPLQASGTYDDAGRVYLDASPSPGCGDGEVGCGEDCDDGDVAWEKGDRCNAVCASVTCGDPDDSGKLTASDALFALQSAVGLSLCSLPVCDATADGELTASDALAILKSAVSGESTLTCASS